MQASPMICLVPSIATLLACLAGAAQAQHDLDWLATHDGPASLNDFGRACAVDALGNVYVAGSSSNPAFDSDFETLAYSPSGGVLWVDRRDGLGSSDFVNDIAVAPSGDVYICGSSWNGIDLAAALVKYSASGVHQWSRFFDGSGGFQDIARAIAFDASGNVLVAGEVSSDITGQDGMVLCYSPAGSLTWSAFLDGGLGNDTANAISMLPNGEIVVAGQMSTAGGGAAFVAALDSGGAELWTTILGGGQFLSDSFSTLAGSGSQRIVAAGYTSASDLDFLVAELDRTTGAVVWTRTYDGPAHGDERASFAAIGADGTVWVTGTSPGIGTGQDIATLRFDASGTPLSALRWNGPSNLDDWAAGLVLGSAGQAWVAGSTRLPDAGQFSVGDAVIVQYDASGAQNWSATFSAPGFTYDSPIDMSAAPSDRLVLAGTTSGNGGLDYLALQVDVSDSPQGYCTAKTTSNGCVPLVTFEGLPSASAWSGFTIRCAGLRNDKSGLLFYGLNGPLANPFQGGTLCVQPPIARTPIQSSNGNPSPADDCSGEFSIDMNAFAAGAIGGSPLAGLQVAGTSVCCQFWGRDPGFPPPQNTLLSSGLRYEVLP